MKTHNSSDGSGAFLTGAILMANLDYSGLLEYALRAAVGGFLWMAFKVGTDYMSEKAKLRAAQKNAQAAVGNEQNKNESNETSADKK